MKKKKRNVSRHYSDYPPLESYPPLTKKEQEALVTREEVRQERALSLERKARKRLFSKMKRGRLDPETVISHAEGEEILLLNKGAPEDLQERGRWFVRVARWDRFILKCRKWKKERKGSK